jgi:Fe2+ or Zn2+ uptake regulation protein
MIGTHQSSAPPVPSEAQLREALEKTGLRFTRQRAAVYRFVQASRAHPTAEEVYAGVQREIRNISLATVYKALDALVESHLVTKITHLEGPCRYDCRREAHYHFHCLNTRQLIDLPTPYDPDLVDKLDPQLVEKLRGQGFHVTGYRLELHGFARDQ